MAAQDAIAACKTKLEALIAPIGGGAGVDVTYDEAFERVKAEFDKLTAVAGGKIDWPAVVTSTEELLTERGKDFRVAVYFMAARGHIDGIGGLLDGFVVLDELISAFWDTMGPAIRRPKARGNLIAWYSEFAVPEVQKLQPTARDADAVMALSEVSERVDGALREKLGEAYTGIDGLRAAIRGLVQALPKEAPKPQPQPQAEAAASASAASSADFSGSSGGGGIGLASITNPDAAASAISECSLLLARAGDALRAADPGNAVAYHVLRTGIWLELNQAPPSEGGVTLVPPPPTSLRERFDALAAAENWVALINAADEVAVEYPLWLDPHRYVSTGMDRVGALLLAAKKVLLREVGWLLARVPTLANLRFSDGTPLADGSTKQWIESEVQPALGGGGSGGGGGASGGAVEAAMGEARGLAASGKLREAIEVVTKAGATAPTPAERFRGRLAVAKLCLDAGQFAIARAQLEGLDHLIEAHRLADWEPGLCAEVYGGLYSAHRGLNRGDEVLPEARALEASAFQRLCQLDAGLALKLSS